MARTLTYRVCLAMTAVLLLAAPAMAANLSCAYGGAAGYQSAAGPQEGGKAPRHLSPSFKSSNLWRWDLDTFLMVFYSALNIFFIIVYTKSVLSKGLQSYYGRWKLFIHFVGASMALMSGSISLILYKSLDIDKYAEGFATVMASAVLTMGGIGAIAMARYTQGDLGTNLAGYVMYSLIWMQSACDILVHRPTFQSTMVCFLLSQAFAHCRLLVWVSRKLFPKASGEEVKMNYSIATGIAAGSTALLAYRTWRSLGVYLALGGLGFVMRETIAPYHVRYRYNKKAPAS